MAGPLTWGCGSGFQSVALAELGFSVLAIDLSPLLLRELEGRRGNRSINTVQDDLLNFNQYVSHESPEVIVCMGDTLTHLDSIKAVDTLLQLAGNNLQGGGRFVIGYRDMSRELVGPDRIIPVHSDENKIMTAFLEYFPGYVVVNDFIYTRTGGGWDLRKGSYRKLRIDAGWVKDRIAALGMVIEYAGEDKGFSVIIAAKG
ncbi:MAG TPA: class I SAM-dependent methyltransferase [Desulfotomaculum sp.]|nr:class I SAM-dependent methyltransferase [Desulfotomaculum sp.]